MKLLTKLTIAAAFSAMLLPGLPAAAQAAAGQITLASDIKVEKIVTAPDGSERTELVTPTAIIPGDRLIIGISYVNNGTDVVDKSVVSNPLPAAVRLAPDADPALDVSVDGGKTWGKLAALTLANPDGTERGATHADVTHVRWVLLSIAPGVAGRLTFPAIIR